MRSESENWDGWPWHESECFNPDTSMYEKSISNHNNTIILGEYSEIGSWEWYNLDRMSEFLIKALNNKVNNNPYILKMMGKYE